MNQHNSSCAEVSRAPRKLDWVNTLFLCASPVAAVVLTILHVYLEGFNPWLILVFVIFYLLTGLSITGGYHRLFAHRAYDANVVLRGLYLLFGAAAVQNSALKWSVDHRLHHRFVDEEKDPYNINRGFWWAHMGWVFFRNENWRMADPKWVRDLYQDKLILWQHRYYLPLSIGLGFGLPTLIGYWMGSWIGGLAIAGFVRIVAVHHFTFFINSFCHMYGDQGYEDGNTARDSFWLALLTYGEGYHNFHHRFEADYRNGIRWYHWDPTKWLIKLLSWVKLTKNLKKVPDVQILKARLEMDLKKLRARLESSSDPWQERMDLLRARIMEAQKQWRDLQVQYRKLRHRRVVTNRAQRMAIKAQMRAARLEYKNTCAQWQTFVRYLRNTRGLASA
ncbi:MAG: fatty acid desaturase [Bdellovibrionaceae bacterium]|nr:fatty acid desaturase [Bdellovibrionales bacterium]MCB9082949.1 fatty acid desaturase [Pseudobdellovibrionaceae bacterium]